MASIRREIIIDVRPEHAWDAVRDVGALHTRLVTGFVTDCRMEGDIRVVTFANGMVVREPIVDVDDEQRRMVWAAVGGRLSHYNASLQLFSEGPARTRAVWIADLLPHEMSTAVAGMIEQGLAAMKTTLERAEGH